VERLLVPYSITAATPRLEEKRRAFRNFFSRLYNSFMTSQAGDGTLSAVEGRPVMVFHADGVRGGPSGRRTGRADRVHPGAHGHWVSPTTPLCRRSRPPVISQTATDTLTPEDIMRTRTRQTMRRSTRFPRATAKTRMVIACCGLLLWSAVSAHAGPTHNGLSQNGWANDLALQPTRDDQEPSRVVPNDRLPFNGLSQQGIGKRQP
jgi:hypothetical protein